MKRNTRKFRLALISMIVALLFALPVAVASADGPSWTEYGGNPVFGQGVGGPKAYYPSVLYDADEFSEHGDSAKYKMWYGTSGSQTGLATSNDGISWNEHGVVMSDGYHATVKYFSDGFSGANSGGTPNSATMYYRMWYWDVGALYDVSAIGYTESPDGVNWYNYQSCQNATVPIVDSTGWNRGSYGPCDVLYNPGATNSGTDWTFTMYYDGTTGGDEAIGLGFSSDGITWTGYDADSDGKANPVLNGTYVAGDWDYNYVSRATIIKNADDDYEVWYSGGVGTMNHGIGCATSSDGINWTRDADNPIFHKDDTGYPGEPWRQERTYCPSVIKDGTTYKMWFSGKDASGNYAIGYATGSPPPSEVWVDDDWASLSPGDPADGHIFEYDAFATIQDGIDNVAGSTVNVAAGTYNPTSTIVIDKDNLVLQGPQADVDPRPSYGSTRTAGSASEAVIDGCYLLKNIVRIFADDVVINGLEIRSGTGDLIFSGEFGVARHINRPSVKYNIIHDSSKDEGVQLKGAVDGVYEYNHVFDTGGDGLNFAEDGNCPTRYCVIRCNEIHDIGWYTGPGVGPSHGGIFVYNDGYGDLDVEIRENLIYHINTAGIKFGDYDWAARGGEIIDNIIRDTTGVGVRVRASDTTVAGNEISQTGGITVESKVARADTVLIQFNSIQGNTFGVKNTATATVDATNNWWGDASGPKDEAGTQEVLEDYSCDEVSVAEMKNANGLGDEVSDNVDYCPWLEALPMSKFVIDHAKIDFKKKPDDDKVRVQGKLELDTLNGNGVDISEDVIVTVGPLSETIPMVEKGKKGDKWEYKRPKDGEGIIKHMTIDWKNGKFDIRIDDVDLDSDEFPNPVTISVQIGDDVGSESITMSEKKHHWDYKAEKPKKPKAVGIEPFAITDPLKVVAYPNPIRDVDTATFQVMGTLATQVEEIRVQIYDLSGRLVWEDATLGSELDWHTNCLSGDYLANGIYLYSVQVRIGGSWINQDIGKIAVLR